MQVKIDVQELTHQQLLKVVKSLLEYLDVSIYVDSTPDYEEYYVRKEAEEPNWKSEWP